MVLGVPGNTVDGPSMTRKSGDGLLTLDVVDVHRVVCRESWLKNSIKREQLTFTSRSNEIVIMSSKTRVNDIKSLVNSLELPHKNPVLEIPQMKTTSHDVQQSSLALLVDRETNDGSCFLNSIKTCYRLSLVFKSLTYLYKMCPRNSPPDPVMAIGSQDVLGIVLVVVRKVDHTNSFPLFDHMAIKIM